VLLPDSVSRAQESIRLSRRAVHRTGADQRAASIGWLSAVQLMLEIGVFVMSSVLAAWIAAGARANQIVERSASSS
jgi:hypothetical protein